MKRIMATVKSVKEITGAGNDGDLPWFFSSPFLTLSKSEIRVECMDNGYYRISEGSFCGFLLPASWLKDIREETDWKKVSVDALVKDRDTGLLYHFAEYKKELSDIKLSVWVYAGGRSSKTVRKDAIQKMAIYNPELVEVSE